MAAGAEGTANRVVALFVLKAKKCMTDDNPASTTEQVLRRLRALQLILECSHTALRIVVILLFLAAVASGAA